MSRLKNIHLLVFGFILIAIQISNADRVLEYPRIRQEKDQWCWAAASQWILGYHGVEVKQSEIASYGFTDGVARNHWNWLYTGENGIYIQGVGYGRGINLILKHWDVPSKIKPGGDWQGDYTISEAEFKSDIENGHPFVVRYQWNNGGGHFVVAMGYKNGNCWLMNPWQDDGIQIYDYDWVHSGSDRNGNYHTWKGTLQTTKAITIPTYTVTYSGNGNTGGTAPSDINSYKEGDAVTVLDNTGNLVKAGYNFAGWNTAADGTGKNYDAGRTFTMGTANVTLHAQWAPIPTYTVTYAGNGNTGGTEPSDTNKYKEGDTVTVLGNTGNLAKEGYSFEGWNTMADGTGKNYDEGRTFTMGKSNVTLHARWTLISTYIVTYNGNGNTGGTAPSDTNRYKEGDTVTVLDNTGNLVKAGYNFAGWNTAADGTGASYAAGQTFSIGSADDTLHAQWNIISYSFTISAGEGGSVTPSGTVSVNHGVPLSVHAKAAEGYHFTRWVSKSGIIIIADSTKDSTNVVLSSGNAEMKALFGINKYVMTLAHTVGKGEAVIDRDTVVVHGDTLRVDAPQILGCAFAKWRITEGKAILLDSTSATARLVLTSGNATLTAVFNSATGMVNRGSSLPTTFDISFNANTSSLLVAIPPVPGAHFVPVKIRLSDIRGRSLAIQLNKGMKPGYHMIPVETMAHGLIICTMQTAAGYSQTLKIVR